MANCDLKILCVDDEEAILELYQSSVVQAGFTPILCSDPAIAVEQFKAEMPEIVMVISDFQMPKMSGFEFRQAILPAGQAVPFVIASSYITRDMALHALDLKIDGFYEKPLDEDVIKKMLDKHSKARVEAIRETQEIELVFVEEASTIIEEMESVLISLDHDRANMEKINLIFRAAHTIKGTSGVLSHDVVTRYVHKFEDIISDLKKNKIEFNDHVYEVLVKGCDRIKELISSIIPKKLRSYSPDELLLELDWTKTTSPTPSPNEKQEQPPQQHAGGASLQKTKDSVAVPIEILEKLSACSGEITVLRNMVNKLVKSLERQNSGSKEVHNLSELLDEMHKINSTIQCHITDLRKVPMSSVLKPFPRLIRDLEKELRKSISLKIEGEKLRVDNVLATACTNSIVHLVRNSADHGIEAPDVRLTAGKNKQGSVSIRCQEVGEEVHITISDDGNGIDPERIRHRAIEKSLYTPEQLDLMSEQEIFSIIFAPGFSTAAQVTDISGRGVGMDMVKASIEAVGGQILIESKKGLGSTFILKLPIPKSVLIITSLLVEASNRVFAVPQDAIHRVLRVDQSNLHEYIQNVANEKTLRYNNEVFPVVSLAHVLSLKTGDSSPVCEENLQFDNTIIEFLIIEIDRIRYALQVDAIYDAEEIVVKRIQPSFNPKGAFLGATFMGDGTVGLIVDVKGIAELAGVFNAEAKHESMQSLNQALLRVQKNSDLNSVDGKQNYLLFRLSNQATFGVVLDQVFRLEEFNVSNLKRSGGEQVVVYRNEVMPILSLGNLLGLKTQKPPSDKVSAIVARRDNHFFGLEVDQVVDILESSESLAQNVRDRSGVVGNLLMPKNNVTIVDIPHILGKLGSFS